MPTPDTQFKTRENRLRRAAERQGLTFRKARRMDPKAVDYGQYSLYRGAVEVFKSKSLDDLERFLTS